jgi:hypothetical protein
MTHNLAKLLKGTLLVGATTLGLATAGAQEIVIAPPDACIATFSPVYYEGNAAYWCGDNWYYRNGRGWGMYRTEPAFLHSHRGGRAPAPRQMYGRARAGGGMRAGSGGARGGGGGHAGGGHAGGGGHR